MKTVDERQLVYHGTRHRPTRDDLQRVVVALVAKVDWDQHHNQWRPYTVVEIKGQAGAWIAQEIVDSNTAARVSDDPDYALWYVTPPDDVPMVVYMNWIRSWIETEWMPSLADYLRTVVTALKEGK